MIYTTVPVAALRESWSPVVVRRFSVAGPCLTIGILTGETPRFYCYQSSAPVAPRRVAKASTHIQPCKSCRDHPDTYYPNGYDG